MNGAKDKLLQTAQERAEELFAMACDLFDHPEPGREEIYASNRLVTYLEEQGFAVERGISGLPTSFRAVWQRGSGGPSIGFLLEYDALRDMGHACGHHLQGPIAMAAALALRQAWPGEMKLVLYGTPDEEISGGKIDMVNAGCFRDVDVMLASHTAGKSGVSCGQKALAPTHVTFHGTPAHASGSPWKGRSAMDAMLLCFHGLEILREHIEDGSRIHYTILEGTGPSNIVHERAKAHITLRSGDKRYLEQELVPRMRRVVEGACMMTDTTADIEPRPVYWNYVPVPALSALVLDCAEEVGAPRLSREMVVSNGSTDVGNVSWCVPTVNTYVYYSDHSAHTTAYMEQGKSEQARQALIAGSKILALTGLRLLADPGLLDTIREEHRQLTRPEG